MGYAFSRTDQNHAAVIARLRERGWLIFDTHGLPNFVDCVGQRHTHGIRLFEIKASAKKKLKPSQQALLDAGWEIIRLDSVEDVDAYTLPPTPKTPSETY